ncbi:MAG: DUF3800 domain-containing protein [Intestinibacter sp.]
MVELNLFFDESGKNNDPIKTMGGFMIPKKIYESENIVELNKQLKEQKFKLHWTRYNGGRQESEFYKNVIEIFSKYSSLCDFNVIRYDYPQNINKQQIDNMIYSKLPERVLYGLLRYNGKNIDINADIYVEDANIYRKLELDKFLKNDMNKQSLYRGINFKVNSFEFRHKNQEIGIEFTDLILGIVRNIIDNNNNSERSRRKNEFIMELLQIEDFYQFLNNIKFFEWNYTDRLKNLNFSDYINIFLSDKDSWIGYLSENVKKKNFK